MPWPYEEGPASDCFGVWKYPMAPERAKELKDQIAKGIEVSAVNKLGLKQFIDAKAPLVQIAKGV